MTRFSEWIAGKPKPLRLIIIIPLIALGSVFFLPYRLLMSISKMREEGRSTARFSRIFVDVDKICDIWLANYKERAQQDKGFLLRTEALYDAERIIVLSLTLASWLCEAHGTQDRNDFVIASRYTLRKLAGAQFIDPYMEHAQGLYPELENSLNFRIATIMIDGGDTLARIWPLRASFPYLEWLILATNIAAMRFANRTQTIDDNQLLIYAAINERY